MKGDAPRAGRPLPPQARLKGKKQKPRTMSPATAQGVVLFDYIGALMLNRGMFALGVIILLAFFSRAEAAIYKFTDAEGVVLFTDSPVKGAQRVKSSDSAGGAVRTKTSGTAIRHNYDHLIAEKAEKYSLDPKLVQAVIKAESGFNHRAVSPKGAMGLMQLMPQTAYYLGVYNPFDPEENIEAGVRYLREMLERFGGSLTLALAAYNAGPTSVEKHGHSVPPYRETKDYVSKVLTTYNGKKPPAGIFSKDNTPGNAKGTVDKNLPKTGKPAPPKPLPLVYKVVLEDGTVLYTNSLPPSF